MGQITELLAEPDRGGAIFKLSIVVEEADETAFWLEILADSMIIAPEKVEALRMETDEILKVMAAYRAKLKHR